MNQQFKPSYRKPIIRLKEWDYRWSAAYFITICTKNKQHYFGEIVDGKMKLSSVGMLAEVFWHEIKHHAKHVRLGEFVVMPNHIHAILIICDDEAMPLRDLVGQGHALDLPTPVNRFQNIGSNSVSSIIGSYKAAVTKYANRLKLDFAWQPRFYDPIIRDAESFKTITRYIYNNPSTWESDRYFIHSTELQNQVR
jgi:REP element-mobilizing transposase RayT